MCQRLLRLKPYIVLMQGEETNIPLEYHLNDGHWRIISDVVQILEPFMKAQKLLEGEKFVTISLVPPIIGKIRSNLMEATENDGHTPHVKTIARKMLLDFNTRWGQGMPGTVFNEHLIRGDRGVRKGLPTSTLVAFALDPRFKHMPGLHQIDKDLLMNEIKRRLLTIANEEGIGYTAAPVATTPQAIAHDHDEYGALFDDVEVEEVEMNMTLNQHGHNPNVLEAAVDAQLNMYWTSQGIKRTSVVNGAVIINNPLEWWANNQMRFPLVAKLARRMLCITATSAPSERLFSQAGLTIASDRASLDPDFADTLIFLQDAWDVAERYLDQYM